jgi:hypothetical protein
MSKGYLPPPRHEWNAVNLSLDREEIVAEANRVGRRAKEAGAPNQWEFRHQGFESLFRGATAERTFEAATGIRPADWGVSFGLADLPGNGDVKGTRLAGRWLERDDTPNLILGERQLFPKHRDGSPAPERIKSYYVLAAFHEDAVLGDTPGCFLSYLAGWCSRSYFLEKAGPPPARYTAKLKREGKKIAPGQRWLPWPKLLPWPDFPPKRPIPTKELLEALDFYAAPSESIRQMRLAVSDVGDPMARRSDRDL